MRQILGLAVCLAGLASHVDAIETAPVADHHQHLMSPAAAALNATPPLASMKLPEDLARLLHDRSQHYNDKAALAQLYTEDCFALDPFGPEWLRGRASVAGYFSEIFTNRYEVVSVGYGVDRGAGHIVGYKRKVDDPPGKYFAHVLLSVRKGTDGAWRIAAESPCSKARTMRSRSRANRS